MNGDATQPLKLTLTDLLGSDYAVPNLWDGRFKILLDNDAVLNQRLTRFEDGTKPARTLLNAPGPVELRAYVGAVAGEVAYLKHTGLYAYYPDATEPEALPWTIRPDNGVGRWRLDMVPRGLLGIPGGVASLDGNGFLLQSLRDGAVTSSKIADGAVSLSALGSLTLNDTVRLTIDTGTLVQIVSALANRLKAITGKTSWTATPDVTLTDLNSKGGRTDRAQTWSQEQTFGTVSITGDFILPVR